MVSMTDSRDAMAVREEIVPGDSTAAGRMPKVRRRDLPPVLLQHLLDRIRTRSISADQLGLLATWLDEEPEVSSCRWFKLFPGMIGVVF